MQADLVLFDESPAREVAKKLVINFTGRVGCLIMAKRSGIIERNKTGIKQNYERRTVLDSP
jgi:predicted nucleic acid-binding protein